MPYCEREDLEAVFGATNVAKWADVDNDNDATKIDARIDWAIEDAADYVDSRLATRFTVPFDDVPTTIKNLTAKRAGTVLYQFPRGVVEGVDESSEIVTMQNDVDLQLDQLASGRRKLVGVAPVASDYPAVLVADNKSEVE